MDKKRSMLNIVFAISFKIILLLLAFFTRRILINYAGEEANGLNDLFTSIIGVLGIVEVGAGAAIAFSMYKPIVEGNTEKVSALYYLYRRIYRVIGFILIIVGVCVMPAIPYLAKDVTVNKFEIYGLFLLVITSTYISYTFASRSSLIEAHKNNYVTTAINSICTIFLNVIQIITLLITKSFVVFLVCKVISSILNYVILRIYVKKKYGEIIANKESKIDPETKKEVTNNIKAMFMHKIGGTLAVTMDSIIISAFLGVLILGQYENYVYIVKAVAGILALMFTPLITIIGHYYVSKSKEDTHRLFERMNLIAFIVMFTAFICVFQIINEIIGFVFGEEFVYETFSVSMVVVINYYVHFLRTPMDLFKDATGLFYKDRYKPIFEGLTNLTLSIAFVATTKRVEGVIISTIITDLFITYIVQGHILHKYAFEKPSRMFFIKEFSFVAIFCLTIFGLSKIHIYHSNVFVQCILNLLVGIGVSLVVIIVCFIIFKELRQMTKEVIDKFRKQKVELGDEANENTI